MKCNCGFENIENAKFCSECGERFKSSTRTITLPKMVTIKEAHEEIFNKKISLSKVYDLVRTRNLPHVNANGKILLDVDVTINWWKRKLKESVKPIELSGLRRIG